MKKMLLVLVAVMLLAIPAAVYAAPQDFRGADGTRGTCPYVTNSGELTDQQKADLEEAFNQMIEFRKENIERRVLNGSLTEEQGKLALERIEQMIQYHEENGFGYGSGMMDGYGNGYGGYMNRY